MNTPELTLYYDGLCPLCSREIDYYRHRSSDDLPIHYVDITDPQFNAQVHGLDPVRIHKHMHAKLGDKMLTGLDVFIAIWRRIRGHHWLATIASLPGIYHLLWLGYIVFAWVRPMLPRRKRDCDTGACRR